MTQRAGIYLATGSSPVADQVLEQLLRSSTVELPQPCALGRVLVDLVDWVVVPDVEFLASRDHRDAAGREPCVVVYFTDDADVRAQSMSVGEAAIVVVGTAYLYRLVTICSHLALPFSHRPRMDVPSADQPAIDDVPPDPNLTGLLAGVDEVTALDASALAGAWPEPGAEQTMSDLAEWAVFYDLLRLVLYHELAHCLSGHLRLGNEVHAPHLLEPARPQGARRILGATPRQVQQGLELHADEFSVRSNLGQILYGYDPAGLLVRDRVDLADRLLVLNTAFCVFAIVTRLSESGSLLEEEDWPRRFHPPVPLRFDRFRNFQRQFAMEFNPVLLSAVDALSMLFLDTLERSSPYFHDLKMLTPVMVRTPIMKTVERYEQTLLEVEPQIGARLDSLAYFPRDG